MPFACGQTWEASTYNGHWPDQDSIDLGEWTAGDANMSQGEPVLASADGTVQKIFTSPGGDHRVYLDHGDGWVTHYIHLESIPPLTEGQKVGQGEQIGRVGNSGTEAYHLHYTQLQDGKAVRIAFNGSLINTHAGQSPYSPWGNGEKLTSLNCPMNSFVQFNHTDGKRYQLAYKPGTGEVDIDRLNAGGAGTTGVWGGNWTKGWTHLTPFTVGGKPHFFAYKSATGEVDFDRVNPGGLGTTTIGEGTWSKGWTNFMPFTLDGKPYYVAYNHLYGGANLDRINAAGNGASTLWSANWGKGWTHLMPFRLGGVAVLRRLQELHRRRRDRQDHGRRQQRLDHRGVGRQLGHRLVAPGADDAQRRRAHAALQVHDRPGLVRRRSRPAASASRRSAARPRPRAGRRSRRSAAPARATTSPTRPAPARSTSTSSTRPAPGSSPSGRAGGRSAGPSHLRPRPPRGGRG